MTNSPQISVPSAPYSARDVRSGGRWSLAQSGKNALFLRLAKLALWTADRLPQAWLLSLGAILATIAYWTLPSARKRTRHNLRVALGTGHPRARQIFVTAGANLARTLLLRRSGFKVSDHVELDAASAQLLVQRHPGAVFVSAHLGPYEWIAALLAELGYQPSVVVRESYDPRLDASVDHHRRMRGVQVIHRGAPTSAIQAARALKGGRPVGFLPDLGGRVPSIEVGFLGTRLPQAVGPVLLAQRLGRPLLIGTLGPKPKAKRPFEMRVVEISTAGSLAQVTQRVSDALSAAILRCPEHWLWMGRSFPAFAPQSTPALHFSRADRTRGANRSGRTN